MAEAASNQDGVSGILNEDVEMESPSNLIDDVLGEDLNSVPSTSLIKLKAKVDGIVGCLNGQIKALQAEVAEGKKRQDDITKAYAVKMSHAQNGCLQLMHAVDYRTNSLKIICDRLDAAIRKGLCSICMEWKKDCSFDCGHCACRQCTPTLTQCHVCQKPILNVRQLILE